MRVVDIARRQVVVVCTNSAVSQKHNIRKDIFASQDSTRRCKTECSYTTLPPSLDAKSICVGFAPFMQTNRLSCRSLFQVFPFSSFFLLPARQPCCMPWDCPKGANQRTSRCQTCCPLVFVEFVGGPDTGTTNKCLHLHGMPSLNHGCIGFAFS